MIRRLPAIFVLLALAFGSAHSESTPFNFLKTAAGARSAALAGCMVSIAEDPTALFFNPATISIAPEKNISVTFLKHVLDINSGNITYLGEDEDFGSYALAAAYTNYGSFDYRDKNGAENGTFGAADFSLGATYSNELDSNLYYGVTAKFVFFTLEELSTSALALDAGLYYQMADNRTSLGVSLLNVGAQLSKLGNETYDLPLDLRAGVSHRLRGLPLLVNFSFHHLTDKTNNFFDKFKSFSLAGELYLGKYIRARLGYDNQIRNTSGNADKGMTGLSGGFGIITQAVDIDYGYSQYGSSASLHRFSLGFKI